DTRFAASAPGPVDRAATFVRSEAAVRIAATNSLSDGAGCVRRGYSALRRLWAVPRIAAIFSSWLSGRKVLSVSVRETSGNAASRCAMLLALSSEGAMISALSAFVPGDFCSSRYVTTDGAAGFCKLIGLKSNDR